MLNYNVLNTDLISAISATLKLDWVPIKPNIMEPANVIHSQIFRVLELEEFLSFEVWEDKLNYKQFQVATYVGEKYYDTDEQKDKFTGRRIIGDKKRFELSNDLKLFITDKGELVTLGFEYKVDLADVAKEPEKFMDLINVLKSEREDLWSAFIKVKEYYNSLIEKYKEEQ